jgi:hypothetical protein
MTVLDCCRMVLKLEGILNFISGFLLTFFPSFCMSAQGLPSNDQLANANLAQFGSLVLLLGLVGLRCDATPALVEALLIGDFVWMYGSLLSFNYFLCYFLSLLPSFFSFLSFLIHFQITVFYYLMLNHYHSLWSWTFGAQFSFWIVVFLASVRIVFLLQIYQKRNPKLKL